MGSNKVIIVPVKSNASQEAQPYIHSQPSKKEETTCYGQKGRTRKRHDDILSTYNGNGRVRGCTSTSISRKELTVIREARLGLPRPEEVLSFSHGREVKRS